MYVPSPKLGLDNAFMLPLKSARLLGVMMQGHVNVIRPKLSTVPAISPSAAETTPFRIVMNRAMFWEPEVVELVG